MASAGQVTSNLTLAARMGDLSDYLAVWKTALTFSLGQRLALKVGYDLTYNNVPASLAVPITMTGSPVVLGQALVRLKRLDSVATTSLVLNF